jgi:1-acyl-sn-glycerol-3-phosphate acyltransferase
MQAPPPSPKPVSEVNRPELTRLPRLHFARRLFRGFARGLCRLVISICTRVTAEGLENFPRRGPALVVINHLGDADTPLLAGFLPAILDGLGKIELYDDRRVGKLMDWYGVIWIRRGQPDRRAMRAALDGLAEGRILVIAPEGRYSMSGVLEEGSEGAAFLALKSNVPVVPVALTGTDNQQVYGHLRRLRRAPVTLKVGKPFYLTISAQTPEKMREGTRRIMQALADLLPAGYRGIYR